jgi:hypothetical protein
MITGGITLVYRIQLAEAKTAEAQTVSFRVMKAVNASAARTSTSTSVGMTEPNMLGELIGRRMPNG